MESRFDDLPNELLLEIVDYLNVDEAASAAEAYPVLNVIIQDHWQRRTDQHFPGLIQDFERENIKDWPHYFSQIESRIYQHLLPKLKPLFYFIKQKQFGPVLREPLQIHNLLAVDTQKNSLLSLAMKSKNQAVLNYFYKIATAFFTVENNIDAEKIDNNGNTLLHWVVYCGQSIDTIYALLDHGFDINKLNSTRQSALMIAADQRRLNLAKVLLEHEADISVMNDAGKDALMIAIENDDAEITDTLIRYGADLGQPAANKIKREKPLHFAAKNGNLRALKVLLEYEDIEAAETISGKTPLHIAAEYNQLAAINFLLQKNANINCFDYTGATPLRLALINGHDEAALELINAGANIRNDALYFAAMHGRNRIVQVLLERGIDINQTFIEGRTALYIAVRNNHYQTAKLLLTHCANPNIDNIHGITPLYAAARLGNLEMTKLLLTFHANPFRRTNGTYKTAHMKAIECGHNDVANEIEKYSRGTHKFLRRNLAPPTPQVDIGQAFNDSAVMVDTIPAPLPRRNTLWFRQPPVANEAAEEILDDRYIIDL